MKMFSFFVLNFRIENFTLEIIIMFRVCQWVVFENRRCYVFTYFLIKYKKKKIDAKQKKLVFCTSYSPRVPIWAHLKSSKLLIRFPKKFKCIDIFLNHDNLRKNFLFQNCHYASMHHKINK
jgi:hypothetical protein